MKIHILDDRPVSPGSVGGARRSFATPTSCRLRTGEILCVYRIGREKHSRDGIFAAQRSADDGRSWSEPITIYDGMQRSVPESVHAGAVCEARDGTVLAMFTAVEAKDPDAYIFSEAGRQLEQRFYVVRSVDGGRTWAEPKLITVPHTPPLRYLNTRPLLLPDGDLLIPIEVTTGTKNEVVMIGRYSVAAGEFTSVVPCAQDATGQMDFGDPKLVRLPDGSILLWLWAWVHATEATVQAHVCVSSDEGRSWSNPRATELRVQNSALMPLSEDRVIVAGNVRVPPEGIRLWASADGGRTWNAREMFQLWDARQHRITGTAMDPSASSDRDPTTGKLWESLPGFTFGTPDLVRTGDGTLVLTYYVMADGFAEVRACRFRIL